MIMPKSARRENLEDAKVFQSAAPEGMSAQEWAVVLDERWCDVLEFLRATKSGVASLALGSIDAACSYMADPDSYIGKKFRAVMELRKAVDQINE